MLLTALASLAWLLHARGERTTQRWAIALVGIALWQLASGLSNVVLGWPLLSALVHTGGAAGLVVLLTTLTVRMTASVTEGEAAAHPRDSARVRVAAGGAS